LVREKRIQISFRISEIAMRRLQQVANLFGLKPSQYVKALLYRDLGLFDEPIDQRKRTRFGAKKIIYEEVQAQRRHRLEDL